MPLTRNRSRLHVSISLALVGGQVAVVIIMMSFYKFYTISFRIHQIKSSIIGHSQGAKGRWRPHWLWWYLQFVRDAQILHGLAVVRSGFFWQLHLSLRSCRWLQSYGEYPRPTSSNLWVQPFNLVCTGIRCFVCTICMCRLPHSFMSAHRQD